MKAKRIILVEDDADDIELFETFLSNREDIELLPPVHNGIELINYLQNIVDGNQMPDLIVLDQNMPLMSGKETLKVLKSSELLSKIPAVIYSTYTDSSLIIDCKNLGADMVAVKPIDEEGYVKMMDDFLLMLAK
ncbi:MAG TPA: response regulator [Chryseolinea sp.]|jgi:CheY-like chemotaxis protein|nr:response regulator [Chryseolinea sp.]